MITNLCALPILFIAARKIDTWSAKCTIPASFIFQIVVMTAYMFVPTPDHWTSYLCCVFQSGTGMVNKVALLSYVTKRTPKMVRGIVMSMIGAVSSFGCIIYL